MIPKVPGEAKQVSVQQHIDDNATQTHTHTHTHLHTHNYIAQYPIKMVCH